MAGISNYYASSTDSSVRGTVWPQWVSTVTVSTSTSIDIRDRLWVQWVGSGTATMVTTTVAATTIYAQYVAPARTPEQVEADRVHNEEYARTQRDRQLAVQAASDRAKFLLRSRLNSEQLAEYDRTGRFGVVSASGRRFQILPSRGDGIIELGARRRIWCVHPDSYDIPVEDGMLAAKLMLELGLEKSLEKAANIRAA